ncbi:MAG: cupin domain-containing protein, partial [Proteobacteria bacterium]|nr:cupin domain-containing protein [Pseudomonadota bacterium]
MAAPIHLRPDEADEYFFEEGCYILELWNSAADPALSIARVRLPAGQKTRTHRLHHTSERYVILQGSGEARIGDAPPVAVNPGDVV